MKIRRLLRRRKSLAMTMVETLPPIGIAGFLAATMLPALGKAKARANRIKCTSNLKQVSYALKAFAGEYDDRMPWHLTGTTGVAPKFAGEQIFNRRFYPTITADLGTPKILLSPCDSDYKAANEKMRADFFDPDPQAISYGIHHGGDELSPNSILGLTRNVEGKPSGRYYYPSTGNQWTPKGKFFASLPKMADATWQGNNHKKFGMGGLKKSQGQFGRSDGSVMQSDDASFRQAVNQQLRTRDGLNPFFNANLWRSHQ